jgi:putative oxidoreductase
MPEEVPTMIMRRIARPMLAAVFVSGGIETLRNPKPRIQAAEPVVDKTVGQLEDKLPDEIPTDTETLVKLDAAVKIGAGLALALGKFPRLASVLLVGSMVPTTVAAHRFWEHEDPREREQQRTLFFKDLGLIGGLMIAAGDTHGKPSIAWRARHAARVAAGGAADVAGSVKGTANAAAGSVKGTASAAAGSVKGTAAAAAGKVQDAAGSVAGAVKSALPG